MEEIESFRIDHTRLKPGVFVSRKDKYGDLTLTTFDLRFKEPNKEPVMDCPAMHTIEHMCATFLRSHAEWTSRIVYFGPMGCRTGFYMILEGDASKGSGYKSEDILLLLKEMFDWVGGFEGAIPGATKEECGNFQEQNLDMAKWECTKYLSILRNPKKENLNYPE